MLKTIILGIMAVIVVVVGVAFFVAKPAANDLAIKGLQRKGVDTDSMPQPDQIIYVTPDEDMLVLEMPVADSLVTSPLTVSGRARGMMFFEASFPVELLSADGTVLAATSAQAIGNWMTEDFVPFSAVLDFDPLEAAKGTLILKKSNPSGEAIYDRQFKWSLKFK